jgi:hypothetical protein
MKFRFRRALLAFVLTFFTVHALQPAEAYRLPFPGKVNNLMMTVVKSRAARMGLSETDPRIAATVAGMGSAATDIAVGAAAGLVFGTPIGWGGVLLGAVVVAGITYLSLSNQTKVNVTNSGVYMDMSSLNAAPAGKVWSAGNSCYGTTLENAGACYLAWLSQTEKAGIQGGNSPHYKGWQLEGCSLRSGSTTSGTCTSSRPAMPELSLAAQTGSLSASIITMPSTAPVCASGMFRSNAGYTCYDDKSAFKPGYGTPVNPYIFPDYLPQEELDKPASPDLMAKVANRLWQDGANKTGYAGIPYSMTDPITATDMDTIRQANPDAWPDVADLTAPVASGATGGANPFPNVPIPATGTVTDPDTGTDPGTNPGTQPGTSIDLGPNPNTPAPEVGTDTPTASSIVDPLFDWFPSISGMSLSVPAGECPTDQLDMWGQHLVLDQHCAFIERYRALIAAAMLAVWTMAAATVLLRA